MLKILEVSSQVRKAFLEVSEILLARKELLEVSYAKVRSMGSIGNTSSKENIRNIASNMNIENITITCHGRNFKAICTNRRSNMRIKKEQVCAVVFIRIIR